MKQSPPMDLVGPWAKEKLECLRDYLNAYTRILRNQKWCQGYIYVDAFAGSGRAVLRQEAEGNDWEGQLSFQAWEYADDGRVAEEYIDGSPREALTIDNPFTWYVFIEREPDRVSRLLALKAEFGDERRIVIRERDCNEYLVERIVQNPEIDWRTWRGVVFLDPFGMQVPWSTLHLIGQTGSLEVIVNLPVGMAIQRLLKRSADFTAKERAKLDEYFGTSDWFNVVYEEQPSLLGPTLEKSDQTAARLVNWYRGRLKETFGLVSAARLIRSPRGHHLYYLVWAGRNKTGLKIANHILQQGEQI